ncbi:hypothetical protein KJ590_02605 [Patescibacteria group bacterium]|nr:hypothetical protein [Patescibacteria group bacterium]MBU4142868.1 hypothetical protein [Patescibacteria group bacterium]
MFGIESQRQAFEPDKVNLPSPEPKEGELGAAEKKTGSAKIYPFVRPGEQKKTESLEEGFRYQDMALISKGEVIARFYRGFPTKVISKDVGVYEVLEKKPTGNVVSHPFDNIEEIKFG